MEASIIRTEKTKDYTCIANKFFRDKKLSLKAKGMLGTVLTLPDNWGYSINGLAAILKESRDAIINAIKELKENGYAEINKTKNQKGQFVYEYIFRESNKINSSSKSGNPVLDNPVVENPIQQNIDNKIQNNNNKNCDLVIDYLNQKTNKNFHHTKTSRKFIKARLAEGYTVEDCKQVINNRTALWLNDKRMNEYLAPDSLFRPSNFERYLNQAKANNSSSAAKDNDWLATLKNKMEDV